MYYSTSHSLAKYIIDYAGRVVIRMHACMLGRQEVVECIIQLQAVKNYTGLTSCVGIKFIILFIDYIVVAYMYTDCSHSH